MKEIATVFVPFLLLAQPSFASEPLSAEQLSPLIIDNTLYVTLPAGTPGAPDGGIAPIHYASDGTAKAQLPAGLKLVGTWQMKEASYCIDWDNGPKNSCSSIVRSDAGFLIMDQATGDPRGEVFKISTGNPEQL